MAPRFIGLYPSDVIWANLRIKWYERIVRNAVTIGFVVALIIFWAIPVAFVGSISNITGLIDTLPFLEFINKCPDVLKGLITGLLPAVLMAVLMALLPIILRCMYLFSCVFEFVIRCANSTGFFSDGSTWRCPYLGCHRAANSKLLLRLPGGTGLPCCDTGLSRV